MRQPPQFNASVKAALESAKLKVGAGDVRGALETYQESWDAAVARGDHAHASVIAHMAGVADEDPQRKLRWNLDALREADLATGDPMVTSFYPSLYNNLAVSYALLGDRAEALRCIELAASRLGDLEPGPYADRVRAGVEAQLLKVRSAAS